MRKALRNPQQPLGFEYEVSPDEGAVTSYGGLPLVVETMRALGVSGAIAEHVKIRERESEFDEAAVAEATVLLMASGGDCLDDIRVLREDKALCKLLGSQLPSADTLRRCLYEFHDEKLMEQAAESARRNGHVVVPQESKPLVGLQRAQEHLVAAVCARGNSKRVTLDFDATIIESHKKEALCHYDDGRGYQPAIAYWVEQDLVVWDEFRDGNVPNSKNAREQAQSAFAAVPKTVTKRRARADSAYYDIGLMEDWTRAGIEFSISADMSRSLKETCQRVAEDEWELIETRSTELVHIAKVIHFPSNWDKGLQRPRYVAVRFTPTQGKLFDDGAGPKYLAVVSNRHELPAKELVRWHWEKAGTVEHVHDVVKNELGGGVLPCGRFQANAAWFRFALLTYNVLSALKAIGLPTDLKDARPKRLRFQIFTLPAVVARHARKLVAKLVNRLDRAGDVFAARGSLWTDSLVGLASAG